jgi:hypothetical protein
VDIEWMQVLIAFALGVLLSATVKALLSQARSKAA